VLRSDAGQCTLGKRVIESVIADMERRRGTLSAPQFRYFLDTYQRTTRSIGKAIADARFEDPDWVERWDVAFARFYLEALDAGDAASRPWRLAFSAPAELPPLRHVLLGINAHVNYDLPQALLAVISVAEFGDAALLDRRRRDHERIDGVLAARVGAEDVAMSTSGKSLLDRVLTPLNRLGSKRFLREGRQKVWHNTAELHAARVAGPDAYRARLAELEVLCAARIADLLAPGQVILRLALGGFGVVLPPPA
jgi:hypothetical protein